MREKNAPQGETPPPKSAEDSKESKGKNRRPNRLVQSSMLLTPHMLVGHRLEKKALPILLIQI
jgi:hypothetical protein